MYGKNKSDGARVLSRRSAVKSGIGGLAAVAGLAGSVGSAAAFKKGDEDGEPENRRKAGPPPRVKFDEKLRQLDWGTLQLVADKDRTLEYVSAAEVPKSQRRQARENLKDLWDEVRIKETTKRRGKGSNKTKVTEYKLAGSVKKADEVLRTLKNRGMKGDVSAAAAGGNGVQYVINSGANAEAARASDDGVSAQWDPTDSHKIMNYFAGKNLGLSDYKSGVLESAGDDPDEWEYDVSGVPEDWEESLKQPGRRWAHAWDHITGFGSAPSYAKKYMEKSQNASSDYRKYRNMGYALHFLADMANPMHTGWFSMQIANQWIHYTYEASAEKHLMRADNNDPDIKNYLLNNVDFSMRDDVGPNDYVEVNDPSWYQTFNKWANHARRLSKISHDYSEEHVMETYHAGKGTDVMEEVDGMENQIEYLFDEATKFMMGYVEEYNADVSY